MRYRLAGAAVRLNVESHYPLSGHVRITVNLDQSAAFPLHLRIPAWAKNAMIHLPDGEILQVRAGTVTPIIRKWISGDTIRLELPMEARISRWYHQSAAVEVGPLLMAYQPEEKWTAIGEKCGVKSWQVEPASPWNYALVNDEPMKVVFEPENIGAFGQGEPAVSVLVKGALVPDWGMNGANCAVTPIAPVVDKNAVETVRLVPYGSTGLRISQFPVASVNE